MNKYIIHIIHAFISVKSPYYTGYINYNHKLLIYNKLKPYIEINTENY